MAVAVAMVEDTLWPMVGKGTPGASAAPFRERAAWVVTSIALLWMIEVFALLGGHSLGWSEYGILPRTVVGLRGIPLAPLLHQSPEHLALNTLPLAVLSWLILLRGPALYLRVTITVALLGGFVVWACGRPYYHLGASGVILGYFGYLVARAFLERSWRAVAIALLTVVLYGGLLAQVLPSAPEVSWESHLAGLLAGITAAWWFAAPRRG
jgi:membrane associated rhomboid family serine protease